MTPAETRAWGRSRSRPAAQHDRHRWRHRPFAGRAVGAEPLPV